jgi:hypothetical protein
MTAVVITAVLYLFGVLWNLSFLLWKWNEAARFFIGLVWALFLLINVTEVNDTIKKDENIQH